MAKEPKVLTITTFEKRGEHIADPEGGHDPNKCEWYWHTQSPNGATTGDGGEGYKNLEGSLNGFFAQQGVSYEPPAKGADRVFPEGFTIEKQNANVYIVTKYAVTKTITGSEG